MILKIRGIAQDDLLNSGSLFKWSSDIPHTVPGAMSETCFCPIDPIVWTKMLNKCFTWAVFATNRKSTPLRRRYKSHFHRRRLLRRKILGLLRGVSIAGVIRRSYFVPLAGDRTRGWKRVPVEGKPSGKAQVKKKFRKYPFLKFGKILFVISNLNRIRTTNMRNTDVINWYQIDWVSIQNLKDLLNFLDYE